LTSFTPGQYALAGLAAAAAGCVNAIAGGGTLISFPALVALGAPTVSANVTNTVALCPGYFGGAYAQRGFLRDDTRRLKMLSIAAGFGGLTGSIILVTTGEELFKALVPWMILLACALLGGQNRIRAALRIGERHHETSSPVGPLIATYLMAIYGGYFGAGLGIMVLAVLGLLYSDPLPRLNALKSALALVINLVAATFFLFSGDVLWTMVLVMAPASLLGGMAGGRLVNHIKPGVLRAVVVSYGTLLAIYYLVR
jgi:uncharacterized membrane protein YfcA